MEQESRHLLWMILWKGLFSTKTSLLLLMISKKTFISKTVNNIPTTKRKEAKRTSRQMMMTMIISVLSSLFLLTCLFPLHHRLHHRRLHRLLVFHLFQSRRQSFRVIIYQSQVRYKSLTPVLTSRKSCIWSRLKACPFVMTTNRMKHLAQVSFLDWQTSIPWISTELTS